MQDVLIIGGGASGLAAACLLRQKNKNISVTVAEQLERVGKKLSTTGNGRCNITNLKIDNKNFHTRCPETAHRVISLFDFSKTKEFFSSLGVEFTAEENKVYPLSFQASSVVDALRFSAANLGVNILTSVKVSNIKKSANHFDVYCDGPAVPIKARCVVVACGGLAGGSKIGSNGDGYDILKKFGHRIFDPEPVIVQVKTDNNFTRQLKGIKVTADVYVKQNSKVIAKENGEVLFCDYGLSGPAVLQLSRYCKKSTVISLDMLPYFSVNEITKLLLKRVCIFANVPLTDFFAGFIHKKLGQTLLKSCDINLSDFGKSLTEKDCMLITEKIKNFEFSVLGHTGFVNAQATSGGADLSGFNINLMSKNCDGLFAAGEVLDVDGDCGGYNLQWAWSSAAAVANGILNYLSEK